MPARDGRVIDGTGATLARLQYTYDALGNRLTATRSPRPSGGLVGGTWEDQASAYDALSRLVSCDIEHQDGVSTTLLRGDDWDLDLLGNWRARVMAAGGASTVTEAHETDA
ncbi:MAG: hypothetical protein IT437_07460, partial [Phycisphaerales bacterium]|nr:hypothetical protein [Phycisphaerales bacterium]